MDPILVQFLAAQKIHEVLVPYEQRTACICRRIPCQSYGPQGYFFWCPETTVHGRNGLVGPRAKTPDDAHEAWESLLAAQGLLA